MTGHCHVKDTSCIFKIITAVTQEKRHWRCTASGFSNACALLKWSQMSCFVWSFLQCLILNEWTSKALAFAVRRRDKDRFYMGWLVMGRFAHFPVRPESFRPRVVSPSITWVVSPSYPESFRPLLDESFRPLSRLVFCWGCCDKFTVFVSFNEEFGYLLKHLICPSSAEAKDSYTCTCIPLNWRDSQMVFCATPLDPLIMFGAPKFAIFRQKFIHMHLQISYLEASECALPLLVQHKCWLLLTWVPWQNLYSHYVNKDAHQPVHLYSYYISSKLM